MRELRRWTGIAAAPALLVAGCHGGGDGSSDTPPQMPPQVQLSVEPVFPALTFSAPVAMLQAPNDTSRWFVVEQGGVVRVFPNLPAVASAAVADFIDITGRVTMDGEAGLLGMAFHPNFPADPRVYLFYSHTEPGPVLMSRLSEFSTTDNGATLNPATEHILITLPKPNNESNHNGGNLAFGPGSFLFAGIGDGGGGNDQHGMIGNAQNTNTLFGKMLRIDISGTTGTVRYRIPPSNPFSSSATLCNTNGTGSQPCPEIFAIGLRNPWRWSFDRATGQLWVGDVGQNAVEEVDRVDLGGNYGWRCFEGTRTNTDVSCGVPGPFIPPVAQYGRNVGVTVTGGYVYRGTRFQGLVGRYIFADFGFGTIFSIDATAQGVLEMTDGFSSGLSPSSFGEGLDGELYVVDYGGGGLYHIRQ
jgi:glucose/arabinose dehydrogenase